MKMHAASKAFSKGTAFLITLVITLSSIVQPVQAQPDGEKLFKTNCASCHKVDKVLTGPALQGWAERVPEGDWIYEWVRNSTAVIAGGDAYGSQIFNEYNKTQMTNMPHLSNEDVDAIMSYVDNWTPPVKDVVVNNTGGGADEGVSTSTLLIIVLLLGILALVLTRTVSSLDRMMRGAKGEDVGPIPPLYKLFLNARVITGAIIILVVMGAYDTFDMASALGRQQGYAPTQPIKYSHKLHAGDLKIDCQYCHVGAWDGKAATIPSPNICMNCHKAVKEGPTTGTEEIAKIYEAVGWDVEKMAYTGETKPIEWIRIHNLPDHVYFNHAQHVNAGKQECQTCHGPVEEMEVLEQHSSLGMGWCINCHRETEVQFISNDYYSSYENLHEKLKNKEIDKVTAAQIGATDCQKCHY